MPVSQTFFPLPFPLTNVLSASHVGRLLGAGTLRPLSLSLSLRAQYSGHYCTILLLRSVSTHDTSIVKIDTGHVRETFGCEHETEPPFIALFLWECVFQIPNNLKISFGTLSHYKFRTSCTEY